MTVAPGSTLAATAAVLRDLDYRFDADRANEPVFTADDPLSVEVTCANATSDCTPSILFLGRTAPRR